MPSSGVRDMGASGYRVAVPDEPVLLKPGEGESTERYTLLADREELVLTEFRYPPNEDGPQRHIHRHHADGFYCLEGRLRITLDEADQVLGPGGFVLIPPGVIHTFGNPADEPGRYLNFHAPGCGFGDYLRGDKPDFDQIYDVPPGSGRPTTEALVRQPGEGEQLGLGPSQSSIKAGADDGMGSLAVLESTIGPNFPGPPLHLHERMVDSFYILAGTFTLRLGDDQVEATGGCYALVPPGNAHTFATPEDPVKLLNIFAPAGFEGYVRELAKRAQGGDLDQAGLAEIASKYDFRAI
jgi:mannose-6-phosphate isomerase-like protein (cupin superfamily)